MSNTKTLETVGQRRLYVDPEGNERSEFCDARHKLRGAWQPLTLLLPAQAALDQSEARIRKLEEELQRERMARESAWRARSPSALRSPCRGGRWWRG